MSQELVALLAGYGIVVIVGVAVAVLASRGGIR